MPRDTGMGPLGCWTAGGRGGTTLSRTRNTRQGTRCWPVDQIRRALIGRWGQLLYGQGHEDTASTRNRDDDKISCNQLRSNFGPAGEIAASKVAVWDAHEYEGGSESNQRLPTP